MSALTEVPWRAAVLDAATAGDGIARVLDVGSGDGGLALALAGRLPGAIVAGVEPERAGWDRSRVATETSGTHVEWRRAPLTRLPFAAGGFQRVTLLLRLHRLPPGERMRVLRECGRVLAPDGLLVVAEYGRPWAPHTRAAALVAGAGRGAPRPSDELLRGLLPARMAAAGLTDVRDAGRFGTRSGLVEVLTARPRRR